MTVAARTPSTIGVNSWICRKLMTLSTKYFVEAGFDVLGMEGINVAFDKVGQLSAEQVYAFVKQAFLKHRKADAIYLLGTGWRVLPVIDLLEQDLGVPVVHPVPARCWEIQLRLSVRQPVKGYGRLVSG